MHITLEGYFEFNKSKGKSVYASVHFPARYFTYMSRATSGLYVGTYSIL